MASKPYDPQDRFFRKAKEQGLRARSAFKLQEIDKRFHLLRPGMAVLDLGAAPGGWLQIIGKAVGPKGTVVGVDLEAIAPLPSPVITAVLDIRAPDLRLRLAALHAGPFDVVTSDMAPKTIGVKMTDEARSLELASLALQVARETLVPGGTFVAKVFEGGGIEDFQRQVKTSFSKVKRVRPEATRERSMEIFVVAQGYLR